VYQVRSLVCSLSDLRSTHFCYRTNELLNMDGIHVRFDREVAGQHFHTITMTFRKTNQHDASRAMVYHVNKTDNPDALSTMAYHAMSRLRDFRRRKLGYDLRHGDFLFSKVAADGQFHVRTPLALRTS
jgi:hypothetical protein